MVQLPIDSTVVELLIRVLCDTAPRGCADGAYLYAQTAENQGAVLEVARELVASNKVERLLLPESAMRGGYPGFHAWRAELLRAGVAAPAVVGVNLRDAPMLNTLEEARALARQAMAQRLATLYVVATPFHQLRAFMTTVTTLLGERDGPRVYSRTGAALPWCEEVAHSQGTLVARRAQLIHSELERIARYQAKGDLASFDEILGYLHRRDGEDAS